MNKTWSELSINEQSDIIKRHFDGETVLTLSGEYNLNPESLSRTIRKLRGSGQYEALMNYIEPNLDMEDLHDNGGGLDIVITNIDSSNPHDRMCMIKSSGVIKALLYSDPHFPYSDQDAVNAFLRAVTEIEHDIIICGGDNLECYGLSKYAKDPQLIFKNSFQKEVDEHIAFTDKLQKLTPDSKKISLFGNHMDRYLQYLNNNGFMHSSSAHSLDNVLKMEYYGFYKFVDRIMVNPSDNTYYPAPQLIIEHGTTSRKHGASSVRSQSESFGYCSVAQGHVHRLAVIYKRTLRGQVAMIEAGTLRNLNPDFISYPDHQLGFVYLEIENDFVSATPIMIHNGKAKFGNKTI